MASRKSTVQPGNKQTLITPSASPPSSHSFFPKPYKIPDQASPTKRPRLSSNQRQNDLNTPISANSDVDIHKAREDATMRMLDVWASLAERHSRPLDEDDIIDIGTGKVVKDRGVLRGSRSWTLGIFADATAEVAEEELEENEDEDADELDTLTNAELEEIEVEDEERRVRPVTDMDSRDAEDLKDFLEAERRRRELYGSEVDDDSDGSIYEQFGEAFTEVSCTSESAEFSDVITPEDEVDTGLERTPSQPVKLIHVDSESDDELNSWRADDSNAAFLESNRDDSDDDVEIVDMKPLSSIMSLRPLRGSPARERHTTTQRQLQTPPHSHTSSSIPSATPDDYSNEFPPESSSPPRTSSPFSSLYESSPTKPHRSREDLYNSDFGFEQSAKLTTQFKSSIPRLDLTQMSRGGLAKPNPTNRTPKNIMPSTPLAERVTKRPASAQPVCVKGVPKSRVEVVIKRRATQVAASSLSAQIEKGTHVPGVERKMSTASSHRDTGDEKAPAGDGESSESGVLASRSPSPAASKNRMRHSPPQSKYRMSGSHRTSQFKDASTSPGSARIPRKIKREQGVIEGISRPGRKRKRVVSTTHTDERDVTVPMTKPARTSSRNMSISGVRRHSGGDESAESDSAKARHRGGQLSTSERQSESPEHASDYASDEESHREHQRYYSRAPSHSRYPYAQPSHSQSNPQLHISHLHMRPPPIPDPRAQLIITQAMQQLSALVGGAWTPPPSQPVRGSTPYTTAHQAHRTGSSASVYSSPVYQSHSRLYPYGTEAIEFLDSHGTRYSSPVMSNSGMPRQKSLVKRSFSRGRRVSFDIHEDYLDVADISPTSDGWGKGEVTSREEDHQGQTRDFASTMDIQAIRRKGKERIPQERSDLDSATQAEMSSRGRLSIRSQTPGPPSRSQEPRPSKGKFPSARRKSR